MIIGNGDIAKALNDRNGVIFFASGVSNSQEKDASEFLREGKLLYDLVHTDRMVVYFSSISIDLVKSPYTNHKIVMEAMVRTYFDNYCIIRLGNISWGENPNTFINYIRNRIKKRLPVDIRDEWKFMINEDQLRFVTDNLPLTGKHEISIFGTMKKVKDLI